MECPSCGSLIEGAAYNDGMLKGISNITKLSGSPCRQEISCSRLDSSPNGLAQISITIETSGNPQTVEFGDPTASLTLECGTAGKYIMVGYPDYPLSSTIQCESSPAAPTTTTTTTTTTTKPPTTTTTPAAPTTTTSAALTTTTSSLPNACPSCGSLIEGAAYSDGMVNGIVNMTKNSGPLCTQQIICSRLDASPDGFVQISITMESSGEPQALEFGDSTASLTLECGSAGKYIMVGYPEYPLTNTIQCESTPATPTTATTTTTTTTTTTKAPCPEGGTWSAWSAAACNDTCGLCGVKVQTRQCTSAAAGCPCTGATEKYGARCEEAVCAFPRGSCCTAYAKRAAVNGKFKCVPL
uniref:Uncharacterized protein n=1 Tax=Panagrolaimus sp. ES5 TaxID=591445 RepID=A0AC34F610_9BILA